MFNTFTKCVLHAEILSSWFHQAITKLVPGVKFHFAEPTKTFIQPNTLKPSANLLQSCPGQLW